MDYAALMLFVGIIVVYCENHTKYVNISCWQNSESPNVKACGTSMIRDSSVNIATGYGLDDQGGGEFKSR
jgi:hypothetical protein